MKHILIVLLFSFFCLSGFAFDSNSDTFEPQSYDDAKVIRIRYVEGEAFVSRGYEDGLEEATVNLPVFENDVLGTTDGRLEMYLGRLNYLRLDNETEVELVKVPLLRKTNLELMIRKGAIYLDIQSLDFEKDIEIQTADCGIFLLSNGVYRIQTNEMTGTEVLVYEGLAEVAGTNTSYNIRENQKIRLHNGIVKERPFYFYSTDANEFDSWNENRNTAIGYSRHSTNKYLDAGYEDYESELSRSGRWHYHSSDRINVWIPYHMSADWVPYSYGRWVWHPFYGYVWHSYDSWGWITHHYGCWDYSPLYGWFWRPGYRWAPAWVSWHWNDHYYGWCAWNRHGYRHDRHNYWKRSTIVIRKDQLSSGNIRHIKVHHSQHNLDKQMVFKGKAPNHTLQAKKVNVLDSRGRVVSYKDNGLISKKKIVNSEVNYPAVTQPKAPVIQKKYNSQNTSSGNTGSSGYSRTKKYNSSGTTSGSGTTVPKTRVKKYSDYSSGKTTTTRKSSQSSDSSSSKGTTVKKKKESPNYSYNSYDSSGYTQDSQTSQPRVTRKYYSSSDGTVSAPVEKSYSSRERTSYTNTTASSNRTAYSRSATNTTTTSNHSHSPQTVSRQSHSTQNHSNHTSTSTTAVRKK